MRILQYFCTFLFFSLVTSLAFSQHPGIIRCATDSIHAEKMQDPQFAAAFYQRQAALQAYLDSTQGKRGVCENTLYLPVAVHFQGSNIGQDCAVQMAQDQVDRLNADFAALNDDIQNWYDLKPQVWPGINNKPSCIQFCLASQNHPAGYNLQDGDYAVTVNLTEEGSDFNADWAGYINFWVRELGGGILGYSPLGGNGDGDGIACTTNAFSSVSCDGNNINAPYNLGRTMTHEVGHYLNLEHPWADGGCASDDQVDDTPITNDATYGCPANETITCIDPILWPSYMEYCDDACLFMFSAGQVERMEAHVNANLTNLLDNSTITCSEISCLNFSVQVSSSKESCAGGDGEINFNVSGGTEPYLYSINDGGTTQTVDEFTGLSANTYQVSVVDANNCTFTGEIEVKRTPAAVHLVNVKNEYCGDATGSITVAADEPGDFQYSIEGVTGWQDTSLFNNLSAGSYTVKFKNESNCTASLPVTVKNESNLRLTTRVKHVTCPLTDNGAITISVAGATPPLTYEFNGVQSSENEYTELSTGLYEVGVYDDKGCEVHDSYYVTKTYSVIADDCPCTIFIPNAMTPDGDGLNDLLDVEATCPLTEFHMQIFDRWGKLVFESFDINDRWNGGIDGYFSEIGVYYYLLSFRWGENKNADVRVEKRSGTISVLR